MQTRRVYQFYDKEILKYPQPDLIAESVVFDANTVTMATDGNPTIIPAGTIVTKSTSNPKQVMAFAGTGKIFGILKQNTEITSQSTAGDTATAVYNKDALFATAAIVGFTTHAAQLVTDLGPRNCQFE